MLMVYRICQNEGPPCGSSHIRCISIAAYSSLGFRIQGCMGSTHNPYSMTLGYQNPLIVHGACGEWELQ